MKAVILGAGRIACGLAAQLLRDSGHEVVFAVRNQSLMDHLNRVGRYRVRLAGRETRETMVNGIRAVAAGNTELVASEIADAGLIITSVGNDNLMDICGHIAAGIERRSEPLNILAFENSGGAGAFLRKYVGRRLPEGFPLDRHGFAGVLITRAVTQRLGDPDSDEPLTFVGDAYSRFIVDGTDLRGTLPHIEGMLVTDNYEAWVQKKFCMFSSAHAATAYLGHLKGYRYVHTAIRDPQIRASVLALIKEGQQGLAARYGSEIAGDESDRQEVLDRIGNALLCYPIVRVGREPGRKLRGNDRLVGTALLAEAAGGEPRNIGLAVAAALCFNNDKDPSAFELHHQVSTEGGAATIQKFCGTDTLVGRIAEDNWHRLYERWQHGRVLIDLENMSWN